MRMACTSSVVAALSVAVALVLLPVAPAAAQSGLGLDVQMAAMVEFEGQKDRWGFVFDGMYVNLGKATSTTPSENNEVDVKFDMTQQTYEFAGTYRVSEGKVPVDLVLGARGYFLSDGLKLTGPNEAASTSGSRRWVDGYLGARVRAQLSERWFVAGYADVGAGGSNLSWQALAGVGYQVSKTVSGNLGYRYLSIDYETKGFLYDVAMGGPCLSVGIRF
jgi:opacity protein-like surface antigen